MKTVDFVNMIATAERVYTLVHTSLLFSILIYLFLVFGLYIEPFGGLSLIGGGEFKLINLYIYFIIKLKLDLVQRVYSLYYLASSFMLSF